MTRRIFSQMMPIAIVTVLAGWGSAPAFARWRLGTASVASIAYNQGIAFDRASGSFFFDGVSSSTNSGLYRANVEGSLVAANFAVLPGTQEGYNHTGDLSFDPVQRRVLLPLECYYPNSGGNTCGSGAIAVADPVSLSLLYYVNLDTAQIKKAMWAEISPDGRWIWTSSDTHLLVYRAADVNRVTADRQRAGTTGGIAGHDLGAVLPTSGVTGAAFIQDPLTRAPRLLISINQGSYFEVVAYRTGIARDGLPKLLGTGPISEITVTKSFFANEPEGLAVTGALNGSYPLGGVLHWQMLPTITLFSLYSLILNYLPQAMIQAPRGDVRARHAQNLEASRPPGLRLTAICNRRCRARASATIDRRIARGLGLIPPRRRPSPIG